MGWRGYHGRLLDVGVLVTVLQAGQQELCVLQRNSTVALTCCATCTNVQIEHLKEVSSANPAQQDRIAHLV